VSHCRGKGPEVGKRYVEKAKTEIFVDFLRVLKGDRASVAAGVVLRVPGSTLLFVRYVSRAPFDEFKHTLKECFPHAPFAKFTTWVSSALTRYWTN
jgi:hypothetical protein